MSTALTSSACAEAAFLVWLAHAGCLNVSSGDDQQEWNRLNEQEEVFLKLPPSIGKLVALVLHEVLYAIEETEAPADPSLRDALVQVPMQAAFPFRLLECVAPLATGRLADLVSDIMANPERPLSKSRMTRIYLGEFSS